MASPWIDPDLNLLLTLGLGGPALGLISLFAPRGGLNRTWQAALGVLGAAVGGFGVAAAVLDQPTQVWLPPLALVSVCTLFWGLRCGYVQTVLAWLVAPLRSLRFQAVCLLGGGPLVAVWWSLQVSSAGVVAALDDDLSATEAATREFEPLWPSPAQTDQGQEIPLSRRRNPLEQNREFKTRQSLLLQRSGLIERVIALTNGPSGSNCHGWVFTGGAHWLSSTDVESILRDNGYRLATSPRPGDLVVYRREKEIIHTGVVRAVGQGIPVLVESKWGDLGVFVHTADEHPYGDAPPTYYRSPREGHLLAGLSGAPSTESHAADLYMADE